MKIIRYLFLLLLASCNIPQSVRVEKDAPSVLLVKQTEKSTALAELYVKAFGMWHLAQSGTAYIGRCGTGKAREGDAKSPTGRFHAISAFGTKPCPGGKLDYIPITSSTFACDEQGPFYNTIIDTSAVHHRCKGEDMFKTVPEYNFGLTIDFNPSNTYPDGSNIFIHCQGEKKYTAGCVALEEKMMIELIRKSACGTVIIIEGKD